MNKNKLDKKLRLFDVFAISTGAMFSSGFFLLPGLAAAQTGPSVYLAYLASGMLIIPAMLSVAELATAMPKAGGAYYFLDRSLGPMMGTIGGLGSWFALMFKSAFALIGMGAYLSLFIDLQFTVLALILTIVFGVLNVFGAKETTQLQRILVTILVIIMAFFVIQGLEAMTSPGQVSTAEQYGNFFRDGLHGFVATIGLVFVSYAGLTKVASVAEEVRNPDRNIPLGMFLSLFTAIIIYMAGVYIMLNVLEPAAFYTSLTPVADAGAVFLDWLPGSGGMVAIVVAAVAAFASTGNAGIMSASRYPFAMARDKLVSPRFAGMNSRGTPSFSITVTVICMILILMIFDVEAVAKLASAFQLLLFGLLCLSVIVMRESRIDAYAPGFRSPFYPWMQVAGMLFSVWLIAEMGLLAVALTGVIIVICVAWYYYYALGNIKRQGAIFHVHERLGRNRYEGLEFELLSILNEKNGDDRLAYEQVVARSAVIDWEDQDPDLETIINRGAEILSKRLTIGVEYIAERMASEIHDRGTNLGNGSFLGYLVSDRVTTAEMVVFRLSGKWQQISSELPGELHALILLITPKHSPGLEMRLAGHLAEIAGAHNFVDRWLMADSVKELRDILTSDEHFVHVTIDRYPLLRDQLGEKVRDITLPGNALLAMIHRRGELVIPKRDTVLVAGDELSLIGQPEDIELIKKRIAEEVGR